MIFLLNLDENYRISKKIYIYLKNISIKVDKYDFNVNIPPNCSNLEYHLIG